MQFDHEKLEVYQFTLQFIAWVTPLIAEVHERQGKLVTEICDHLDRASLSVLLNIAEGNGKRQRQTRAKFFDDARGSAAECAACLDAFVAKIACPSPRIEPGKEMLLRIVCMLTKLIVRFEESDRCREETPEYHPSGSTN